jgi:hypothetical protein
MCAIIAVELIAVELIAVELTADAPHSGVLASSVTSRLVQKSCTSPALGHATVRISPSSISGEMMAVPS